MLWLYRAEMGMVELSVVLRWWSGKGEEASSSRSSRVETSDEVVVIVQ